MDEIANDSGLLDGVGNSSWLVHVHAALQNVPRHRAIHRPGVDVGKSKSLRQGAGNATFAGSSRTVDGDDVMGGHGACASSSLEMALRQAAPNDYWSTGASERDPITGVLPGPRFVVMNCSSASLKRDRKFSRLLGSWRWVCRRGKVRERPMPMGCDWRRSWAPLPRVTAPGP